MLYLFGYSMAKCAVSSKSKDQVNDNYGKIKANCDFNNCYLTIERVISDKQFMPTIKTCKAWKFQPR